MRQKSTAAERDLSVCESYIMKIVWDAEGDIQLKDLMEALRTRYNKNYARTTVATFLTRLVEKGYVKTYRKGRISFTHALKKGKAYKEKMMRDTVDFWFDGNAADMLSTLADARKLSKEEIEQIKKILADA